MSAISPHLLLAILAVVVVFGIIEAIWMICRRFGKAPYERGRPLLSVAERTLFEVLERSIPAGVHIAPKVRIADILKVAGASGKAYGAAFGKIAQKHVDFAICDYETFEVLAVVELDDSSHETARARKRDALVNGAFVAARVPIYRVPWQKSYSAREISQDLDELLRGSVAILEGRAA
jgi:hypothetical protein